MKQRFSSLDVKVISQELSRALVGLRISNIYDLSSRICLFKLAKPDTRKQLIVDIGFRCHLTEYSRTTAAAPSPFISRLRKFLKTRRVTAVSQLGTDRIIDIALSDGNFHLLLEFYVGGNIILTDKDYKIVALHRIVHGGGEREEVRVGLQYDITNKQNYNGVPPLSIERLRETLQRAEEAEGESGAVEGPGSNKRGKKRQTEALKQAISRGFPEYPALLLDHSFHAAGFDANLEPKQALEDSELMKRLMLVLTEAENVIARLSTLEDTPGYIILNGESKTGEAITEADTDSPKPKNMLYHDFHPFKPKQFENVPGMTILTFNTFNKAVDEYFSSVESQKLEYRLTEREEIARRKLEAAQKDQENRVGALKEVQELHVRKAQAIEANLLRVEEAINAVNGLIAQGMDWVEIARLIEMEKSRQNPVAKVIKLPLKLYENTVTLLLGEPTEDEEPADESDEEEEDSESGDEDGGNKVKLEGSKKAQQQLLSIDIDLGISPWANARQYYEQRKAAAVKEEKTLKSTKKAIKSTEKKVTTDLKHALKQEKPILRPTRTPFWFEKFMFFVSSDGYLVLGGRDLQQTEILYRRYLKKGDVYVHADVQGATPIFVKNKPGTPDAPIPPGTLSQAGNLCVATSSAWDSKAVMGAWWVNADQVSKTAPSGEFVGTGGFVIRGEKHQLPPAQLLLGYAVMFQISEDSIKNHTKFRVQDEPSIVEIAKEVQANEVLHSKQDSEAPGADGNKEISLASEEHDSSDEQDGETDNPLLTGMESEPDDSGGNENKGGDNGEEKLPSDDTDDEKEYNSVVTKETVVLESGGDEPITQPEADVSEQQPGITKRQAIKHLSARERRQLKKGVLIEQTSVRVADAESQSSSPTPSVAPSVTTTTNTNTLNSNIRGKRGKSKKLATKYQHQDEEDRELALRLLGSAPKPDKLREAAKNKAERQAELEAQKQRRREQHDRAAQAERERYKALQQQGGDGCETQFDDTDTAADLSCLPSLVGTPVVGDEVLAAIPVCAPWAALGHYKYRAKLQPGIVKKGKAVKEILGKWIFDATATVNAMEKDRRRDMGKLHADPSTLGDTRGDKGEDEVLNGEEDKASLKQLTAMELELVKGWRDAEIVNMIPVGKVKIISGGGGGEKLGKGKSGKVGGGKGDGGRRQGKRK
ncbi:hypothetical protein GX48_06628 [Paracoccidioides brasiliensis]|nr:hypothetical protein GX48_06628 [Paracoccidioides brasiliensis]